jgi:NitT/TauT family transport system ATP-binding protein
VDEALFLGDKVCVLTPRPTRLAAEIPIPFGPARSLDLLKDEAFFGVRAKVLSAFENGRPS